MVHPPAQCQAGNLLGMPPIYLATLTWGQTPARQPLAQVQLGGPNFLCNTFAATGASLLRSSQKRKNRALQTKCKAGGQQRRGLEESEQALRER